MKKTSLILSLGILSFLTVLPANAFAFTPFDFFVAARTDRPTGDKVTDPDVRIESHVNGPTSLGWTDTGSVGGNSGIIQIAANLITGDLKLFARANGTNAAATEGRVVFGDTFTLSGPAAVANAVLGFSVDGIISSNINGSLAFQRAEIRARIAPKGLLSAPEALGPGPTFFPDFNLPFADNVNGLLADIQNIFIEEGVFAAGGALTPVTGPVNENAMQNVQLATGTEYQMVYQLQSTLITASSGAGSLTNFLEHDFFNTAIPTLTLPSGFTATTASGSSAFFTTASSSPTVVPEPSTMIFTGLGLAMVGISTKLRKRKSK